VSSSDELLDEYSNELCDELCEEEEANLDE
jgi:hypothetical protein